MVRLKSAKETAKQNFFLGEIVVVQKRCGHRCWHPVASVVTAVVIVTVTPPGTMAVMHSCLGGSDS